jgi:general secretion pathway protein C
METALDNILQLFNEHSRKIATLFSLVLIVVMSLSVARTVIFFMEMSAPVSVASNNRLAQTGNRDQTDYKVSDLELFGKAEQEAQVQQNIDAPETRLNLELQGVFIAENKDNSTAIVAEKNKTGELFAIGDKLPGNATLSAVFVDHVLIKRGTRIEKLMFSDSKFRNAEPLSDTTVSSATGNQPGQTRLSQLRNKLRNNNEPLSSTQTDSRNAAREALSRYQQRLEADPEGTLSELGISAVTSGESKGYSVGSEAQGGIRQAGLQPGDVILSVNGRPVGNVANDTALINQVMASSRVRVEVQRGKRRFFLTVPVPR